MSRRGFALPAALAALVLVSVTSALILARATLELRAASRQLGARVALAGASGSVAFNLAAWDSTLAQGLAPEGAAALASPWVGSGLETHDSLVSLGRALFLVTSTAVIRAGDGGILARVGVAQVVGLTAGGDAFPVPGGWWRWRR